MKDIYGNQNQNENILNNLCDMKDIITDNSKIKNGSNFQQNSGIGEYTEMRNKPEIEEDICSVNSNVSEITHTRKYKKDNDLFNMNFMIQKKSKTPKNQDKIKSLTSTSTCKDEKGVDEFIAEKNEKFRKIEIEMWQRDEDFRVSTKKQNARAGHVSTSTGSVNTGSRTLGSNDNSGKNTGSNSGSNAGLSSGLSNSSGFISSNNDNNNTNNDNVGLNYVPRYSVENMENVLKKNVPENILKKHPSSSSFSSTCPSFSSGKINSNSNSNSNSNLSSISNSHSISNTNINSNMNLNINLNSSNKINSNSNIKLNSDKDIKINSNSNSNSNLLSNSNIKQQSNSNLNPNLNSNLNLNLNSIESGMNSTEYTSPKSKIIYPLPKNGRKKK